jgi:hypothetical protein
MLDSDVNNADAALFVEFYLYDKEPYKNMPFIRIMMPGDSTNVVEQLVRDHHKERFARQWLHYQMSQSDGPVIGTPLNQWHIDQPEEFSSAQMAELQILKFQSVEQVATASDSQLQRVGMGAMGLRERARAYLTSRNQSENTTELSETKKKLQELEAQMAMILENQRKPGRPRKEV